MNLKNIPVAVAAGAVIGGEHLDWSIVVVASAVFAGVSSLGLIALCVVGGSGSKTFSSGLHSAKAGLIRHNALIMAVLFVLLGAIQLGKAFESF